MLQELAERVGPTGERRVEGQASVAHQCQSGGGDDCLGEAPPRHIGRGTGERDDRAVLDDDVGGRLAQSAACASASRS